MNWVGIDGYYLKPSWKFAPLFGPTIAAVRKLTLNPILIAETGAVPAADQPAKIADLFAGVRHYGLLGFVWFDSTNTAGQQFGLDSPAALAAFRRDASSYTRPGSYSYLGRAPFPPATAHKQEVSTVSADSPRAPGRPDALHSPARARRAPADTRRAPP